MAVEKIRDRGQTLSTPTGKLLGIAKNKIDVERAAAALKEAGLGSTKVLVGEDGVALLERVNTFFFSDMEDRVLARHLDELRAGNIIVAIETPSDRVDEAAGIATQHGIERLVHFGSLVVTWLTK